jgi:outer membrane protein TolC
VRQSLWQGGRVLTALAISKLYKKYAMARAEQVAREVTYNAEMLFYSAILEESRLGVLKAAFETASYNQEVVEKLYGQGLVPKYELLRAKVEKSSLKPQILYAESQLRLSKKRLKSFLGMSLDEEIVLTTVQNDTSLAFLPGLTVLVDSALARRPEILQAKYMVDISKKAVSVAKAGYYPSFEAVSTYSWQSQSDAFTLTENEVRSWSVGVNMRVPIFSGGYTRGEVKERQAGYQQAILALRQLEEDVRLEVEEAYDMLLQAKKSLDIQGETIAQAEEGLKIANLRYETGVGTQLEVLSAQTALTAARRAQAEALFALRQARSRLSKASTIKLRTDSKL